MNNGKYFWMMTSWKHGSTALSLCAGMGLNVDFTLEYSHTLLITQKSGWSCRIFTELVFMHNSNRILLAGIRNRAQCPCPRCLIPLSRAHNLGMARDMMQRVTLPRADDFQRRSRISSARDLIYDKHLQVDSSAVKELLKEFSWVPNTVCDKYLS
jgi:hypothetical protein